MLGEGFLEKGEGEKMIGWEEREGQFFFLVQGASELSEGAGDGMG